MCNVTGVTVPVHFTFRPSVGCVEEQATEIINIEARATNNNKCAPIVELLVEQYHGTSDQREKSRIKHEIYKAYMEALEGVVAYDRLQGEAKMMTKTCVKGVKPRVVINFLDHRGIEVDHAEVKGSIVLYCKMRTVEALFHLQQMVDSGELCQLLSRMLSLLADTEVTATASLSPQQYDHALKLLTSAHGK